MKEILNQLVEFFIHPKFRNNFEDFIKVKTIVRAYLLIYFFVFLYVISNEFVDDNITYVKRICNVYALIACILALYMLKKNGSLYKIMYFFVISFIFILTTSSYYSGGIYSADIFWLLVVPIFTFMYNDKKLGYISLFLSTIIILFFYYLEKVKYKDFRADDMFAGSDYDFFNVFTILIFLSMITIFYISGTEKIKNELKNLKEIEVRNIDSKFQYIIENANEIISLHNKNVEVTYISPAVKNILEYDPDELIGVNLRSLFGIESSEYNKPFVHECVTKSGKKVWLEISMNKIYDEIGTGDRFISLARNVTAEVLENKRINELREQIANDFHDEIGNKLAAITLNANVLSLKMKGNNDLQTILTKIQETSKSLYQNSRDFIWSIDSKSDNLGEIFTYISDFGEDFFESLPIEFLSESTPLKEFENIKLPMYSGRHIILICTEAFTNAAKHSGCTKLSFEFLYENNTLTIRLCDNGKGFKTSDLNNGKGMTSIKKRAKIVDFNIKITSDQKGTCITLNKKIVPNNPTKTNLS